MKKIIITVCLFASLYSTAFAVPATTSTSNSNYILNKPKATNTASNAVTIYNDTNVDAAYIVMGTIGGNVGGIKRGTQVIYNAGKGGPMSGDDHYAELLVGICSDINEWGNCNASGKTPNCIAGHYDFYLVKAVHITAVSPVPSCTITCLDDTATSCKQKD